MSNEAGDCFKRTLLDMARTMLLHLEESRHDLWAEAINTACYLCDRLLLQSCRRRRTPYDIISNRRLSLGHCRVVGSREYVFRHKSLRQGKFDSRTDVGMLAGYDRGHDHRVLLDEDGMVVFSQDVKVMELKERRDHNIFKINRIESDLEAAETIFDDELPQQGEQEDVPGSGTAENEDGDFNDRMQIEVDADIKLQDLTYYPNVRRSEQQTRELQRYWFEVACVITDFEELGDIFTFYSKAVSRSDSAR